MKKKKSTSVVCPSCGGEATIRGALGASGTTSYKCRNKSCGRRVNRHKHPQPPVPLCYMGRNYFSRRQ